MQNTMVRGKGEIGSWGEKKNWGKKKKLGKIKKGERKRRKITLKKGERP